MTVNVCTVPICDRPLRLNGLCHAHNERLRRSGKLSEHLPIRTRSEMPKVCSKDGCAAAVNSGGLCHLHYERAFRNGYRSNAETTPVCAVANCSSPVRCKSYCSSHYNKWRRWGTPTPSPRPKPKHTKRDRNGYVMVKAPNSPMAMRNGYVPEHRLVMAQVIGRALSKYENVHHINGIRDDNRPENLSCGTLINRQGNASPTRLIGRCRSSRSTPLRNWLRLR